jgi:hypothetical protein
MRVYLSGGPDRTKNWGLANTKAEAKKLIRQTATGIQFVTSGQSDYIVIPDSISTASMTAMKTGGEVKKLSAFMRMLRSQEQRKSTRRGSRRARSRKRSVRRC